MLPVFSGPLFSQNSLATWTNFSFGMPHTRSIISGV